MSKQIAKKSMKLGLAGMAVAAMMAISCIAVAPATNIDPLGTTAQACEPTYYSHYGYSATTTTTTATATTTSYSYGSSYGNSSYSNASDFVIPSSSTYYLTDRDLQCLSNYDLYVARNEIYARHGRTFEKADLQRHFNSMRWYRGTITPSNFDDYRMLNSVEYYNVHKILEVEKSRNSSYIW